MEYAWSYWSGKNRNTGQNFRNDVRTKQVRPDFVETKWHKGVNDNNEADVWRYDNGVFTEVKATSLNPIDLNSFNKQIWGELNALSKQKDSDIGDWTFGIGGKKAEDGVLTFYLVVTEGTQVSQSLIDEATRLGITFFVSYAYENVTTGGIVFSAPERKNFLTVEGTHMQIGIEKPEEGVQLDWDRAIPSWTYSNEYYEEQP